MSKLAVVAVLGALVACTTTPPIPPTSLAPVWTAPLGEAHVADYAALFLPDHIAVGVSGALSSPAAVESKYITLDYTGLARDAGVMLSDTVAERPTELSLVRGGDQTLVLGRTPKLMQYDSVSGAIRRLTVPDINRHASTTTTTHFVFAAERTSEEVVTVRQPFGGTPGAELVLTPLDTNFDLERLTLAPIGEGILVGTDGTGVHATTLDATGQRQAVSLLTTMAYPINVLRNQPLADGASVLLAIAARSELVFGTVTAGNPPSWTAVAALASGARADAINPTFVVSGDEAIVVVESDALTALPALLLYRLDLASGTFSEPEPLTDGSVPHVQPTLGIAPDGTLLLAARRIVDARTELVLARILVD